MNVLMLSCDPSFFAASDHGFADVADRHVAYAQALAARHGTAELRIVTYTGRAMVIAEREIGPGVRVYPTRSVHRATFALDLLRVLPRTLRGWQPDLVTTQNAWGEANAGHLVARTLGVPFIPQLHANVFSPEFAAERTINRWRTHVAAWHSRRASGVRVVTQAQKRALIEQFSIPESQVFVVPVPVSILPVEPGTQKDIYRARLAAKLAGKEIVLLVARFDGSKNLCLWIAAAERIAAQRPNARFVMVGDGPFGSIVDAAIASSRYADRFVRTGLVGRDALPEIYAAADVFLLSSDHESFGRVLVEAGLCGVPAVSTNSSGPTEIITDNETGLLVPCGDASALAVATIRLLADSGLRTRLGTAARLRARERFASDALIARMADFWTTVAGVKRTEAG